MRSRDLLHLGILAALASCQPNASAPPSSHPEPSANETAPTDESLSRALDEAARGVDDPTLAALLRDHWEFRLRESPEFASRLGVHSFDEQLSEVSAAALERRDATRQRLLERVESLDPSALSRRDAVAAALLRRRLETSLARRVCDFERWNVSANDNPLERLDNLPRIALLDTPGGREDLLARYRAFGPTVDATIELLRVGLERGLVSNAESVRRVIAMLDHQLGQSIEQWSVVTALSDADARHAASGIIEQDVRPALQRYRDFLSAELIPRARPVDRTGLGELEVGESCYQALVAEYTTLATTPQEVHERGLREIARIDAEIQALGKKLFGTDDLSAILERLRTDPKLYFSTAEEIENEASKSLTLAKKAIPEFFGRLPQTDCVVARIPEYKAPFTTIAYYEPPHPDGSKPGEYFVNVLDPQTRPRFEARVLAVHESIPGHHLQIAIAQELGDLPAFRRHGGYTVFVEGWALYTERLAEEMGLYDSDLDRMGMLSFDAWRAGRLVVDTGVHAMGWSRDQAKKFLHEHTALSPTNIDNEVDRYISWPGQALAYKTGQLELLKLRSEAREALGDAFELADFHDAVLGGGAVPLDILAARVAAYIERTKSSTRAG